MPTYEYACKKCREHLEVVQSFKDEPLTECPHCGGELRKVFGNVGIVFKGSGFYKTDSRPAAKKESKTSAKSESTTESKSSDSKSSDSKTADAKSSDGNSSDSKTKPEKSAAAAS
jgi:putative FmdB family regulatory protein